MTDMASNVIVRDLNHCGRVSSIIDIDPIGLFELSNREFKHHPNAIVSLGIIILMTILNSLGWVSAPNFFFSKFLVGKATEHLLTEGISPEPLNDDVVGRVLDKLPESAVPEVTKSLKYHRINSMARGFRVLKQHLRIFGGPTLNIQAIRDSPLHLGGYVKYCVSPAKNPMFFTTRVFLKNAERIEALGMRKGQYWFRYIGVPIVMRYILWECEPDARYYQERTSCSHSNGASGLHESGNRYNLGQSALREAQAPANKLNKNLLDNPTTTPTRGLVFQYFQSIHLLIKNRMKQMMGLTDEPLWLLRLLGASCQKYYLLT